MDHRGNALPPIKETPTPKWMQGEKADPSYLVGERRKPEEVKTDKHERINKTQAEEDMKRCLNALNMLVKDKRSPVTTQMVATWTLIPYKRVKRALNRLLLRQEYPVVGSPKFGMWLLDRG